MADFPFAGAATENYVLGAGYIYFEEEDANGDVNPNAVGSYVGDTPNFALTVTPTKVEIPSSDSAVAEDLISVTSEISRTITLGMRNVVDTNWELWINGASSTVTQTATPVADEAITVNTGEYYQLGATASNPTGVHGLGSVVVQDVTDTTTYVEGTDYELNATTGMIYIKTGGSISDGDVLHIDYTPTANSRYRVASSGSTVKRGALTFISDNTAGTQHRVRIPKVELVLNGDLALKSRDTEIVASMEGTILTRTGYSQVYIDGAAA